MLPFTYSWLIKKNLEGSKIKTILDVGCGTGDFADLVNKENKYQITGLDLFEPYLKICKEKERYTKLVKADLTKKIPFPDKSFDAVICLQTVEHLKTEEGLKLLKEVERVAKKLVIVSTPVGECIQEEYDENKYQRHLSSWEPAEFTKKGYQVWGVGLKAVYGSKSCVHEPFKKSKIPLYAFSFLMNPVANLYPQIGCQMVAAKIIKR